MIQASEKISNVRAFTQRCPDAARRTHDTIGRSLLTRGPAANRKVFNALVSIRLVTVFQPVHRPSIFS